jgi:hypothetical protein
MKKNEYKNYIEKVPYKIRCEESLKIRSNYPNHVPVIVDIQDENLKLNKYKFLVPNETIISYLMYKIRKQLVLESYKGIFLFCDNTLLCNIDIIENIYDDYLKRNKIEKNGDQFLYIKLYSENVFGNKI